LLEELDVLIRARYPLIAINTHEEMRAIRIITALASTQRHRDKGLFTWSRVRGLARVDGKRPQAIGDQSEDNLAVLELIDTKFESGLFVLFDFHRGLEQDHMVIRRLRELAHSIKSQPKNVIFVSPQFPTPTELEKEVKFIDLPLPSTQDIEAMLDDSVAGLEENPDVSLQVDTKTREGLVQALLGLTETEIENALAKAVITGRGLGPDSIQLILDEKKDAIRQSGSLTYVHPEPLTSYGGYARHRQLIEEMALTFTPQAQAYGIEPAKGILAVGLPGVGKDLLKKVTSSIMGKALLDLDMAAVMGEGGGIIGSGAMAIRRALSIAETLSCVLGISEFEKAVGGLASSNRTDGGETARTIGYMLNWMQDRRGGVFVFATANDVRDLAGEQIREGRFTKIIFVDLPDRQDRAHIFAVHLKKRGRDLEQFDLDAVAEASDGFSGAEIENAVEGALLRAFMDDAREVATDDILARINGTRPLSEVKREQIDELRNWARTHLALDGNEVANQVSATRRLEF